MTATDSDVQQKGKPWAWLRTTLVGIGICGLIGPILPLFVLIPVDALRQKSSLHDLLGALLGIPFVWPFAVMFMGAPGALLGALGALWVRFRSQSVSLKRLSFETLLTGLVLGAVVPSPMFVLSQNRNLRDLKFFAVLGASSGIVCAILVFLALKRLGLLSYRRISR